jgi:hypothetical protein
LTLLRHIGVIIYPNKNAGLQNGEKSEECLLGMRVDYGNKMSKRSNVSNLLLLGRSENNIRENGE